MTLLLACVAPVPAAAQSADLRPEVVPPDGAYLPRAGSDDTPPLRWVVPRHTPRILRVAFEAPPPGRSDLWDAARWALDVWSRTPGSPVRFEVAAGEREAAADTGNVPVRFQWVQEFGDGRAGSTDWLAGSDGVIQAATVTLAVNHSDGLAMSREFLRLVALHEVGHVLGLPHSEDPADVMHPGNRNARLSDRDIRSLLELYGKWRPPTGGSPAESDVGQAPDDGMR